MTKAMNIVSATGTLQYADLFASKSINGFIVTSQFVSVTLRITTTSAASTSNPSNPRAITRLAPIISMVSPGMLESNSLTVGTETDWMLVNTSK